MDVDQELILYVLGCSRAFDKNGTEFSGGEAQKLAFGRVLASSSDLVILDEPTRAYDPITEAKFYEDFSNLLIDRTIIFISHRMSSSVFSDKILLVNNGKIEAFDTHENLVRNKDSLYYKLFAAQAENYNVCVKQNINKKQQTQLNIPVNNYKVICANGGYTGALSFLIWQPHTVML